MRQPTAEAAKPDEHRQCGRAPRLARGGGAEEVKLSVANARGMAMRFLHREIARAARSAVHSGGMAPAAGVRGAGWAPADAAS